MNRKNWVWFTGIWLYPVAACFIYYILRNVSPDVKIPIYLQYFLVYFVPILFPYIVYTTNRQRQQRGQTDFSFVSCYGLGAKDERHSKAYNDAAFPDIPPEYSAKIPMGLVLGKHKDKYAYCPIVRDGVNVMVIGTPGSGKSVLLLSWLYSMLYRDEIAKRGHIKAAPGRPYNFFMVDIKGELFEKLLHIKSQDYNASEYVDLQVVQPSNHHSYGWDVFYRIHRNNVSETDYIKLATDIADCLIVSNAKESPFFTENAKKILSGVVLYYAKKGWDFVPIIQKLLRTNLDELLTEIVADAETDAENMGVVLDKLKGFVGKEDNESVGDIESTLKTSLDVFSYPDIQYCLRDNPFRTSPAVLNDGKTNLDLAIEESMLVTYQPIFRLITMQILRHCEADFKEDDERYTCLILDEAARVGAISGLDSGMATLRSKHTALICLFQSISQFKDIYPTEKAKTLLNLCELKVFISGSGDKDTTDYVSAMAGEYEATKMSYKRKGFFGGKSDGNYSTERRPVVDARTLMELREKKEVIAFIYGHYVRCQKLRYFEDPILTPIINQKDKEAKAKLIQSNL